MEWTKTEYGRESKCYCNLTGEEIDIELCDDGTPEEYGVRCAEAVGNLSPALIADILEAAKRYCLHFIALCRESAGENFDPDEFPPVTEETPAEEMLSYFSVDGVYIDDPDDRTQIGYRLSGGCDWEIEHGFEADILDGKLVYLGMFEQNSPWTEPDPDDEWNFAVKHTS